MTVVAPLVAISRIATIHRFETAPITTMGAVFICACDDSDSAPSSQLTEDGQCDIGYSSRRIGTFRALRVTIR